MSLRCGVYEAYPVSGVSYEEMQERGERVSPMKHFKYLKYLLRHKWYVAIECWKRGLYLHAFTHDLSKFRLSEWFPYVEYFYGNWNRDEPDDFRYWMGRDKVQRPFDRAWLDHQHRNQHHWQHWVLKEDEGQIKALPISHKVILQMVCDWIGASKAIRGKDANAAEWYKKVHGGMQQFMHDASRVDFEKLIGYMEENNDALVRSGSKE
jgi:hypothetical protein